jgi:cytochrome c oxidase subunit 2
MVADRGHQFIAMRIDGQTDVFHTAFQHGTMWSVAHLTNSNRWFRLVPAAVLTAVVVALGACGENKDPSALPGKKLAREYGCMACHSVDGSVGVGPAWKGLYESEVTLEGGRVVTVDRPYLVRSIKDPAADVPQGTLVPMPLNRVPDADVQLIVDYIVSLK